MKTRSDGCCTALVAEDVLDRGPLTMLVQSGINRNGLEKLRSVFCISVDEALADLSRLQPLADAAGVGLMPAGDVIHRARSACVTIGAAALGREFKAYAQCQTRLEAQQQKIEIERVYAQTREAMTKFLADLE